MRGVINHYKIGYSGNRTTPYTRPPINPALPAPLRALLKRLDDVLDDYYRFKDYQCEKMANTRLNEADRLTKRLIKYQEQLSLYYNRSMSVKLQPQILPTQNCPHCGVRIIPQPEWENDGINWFISGATCPMDDCGKKITIKTNN